MSEWSDFIAQQNLAVSNAGSYAATTGEAVVEVKGDDGIKLLQGQITADAERLAPGDFCRAALCTNKGRVISTFILYRGDDSFFCRLPADNAEALVTTLKKYGVFYKVDISLRADIGILVFFGQQLPAGFPSVLSQLQHPEQIAEYWVTADSWPQAITALASLDSAAESLWQLAKIRRGWPDIHTKTSEVFLPHALSLDLADAISFTKGCYTGQEIVARTHYRGKSKKRLLRMQLDASAPLPGSELIADDGSSVATVVVSANSGEGRSELLASASLGLPKASELMLDGNKVNYESLPLPWED